MLSDREILNLVGLGFVATLILIFLMLSIAAGYMPECG